MDLIIKCCCELHVCALTAQEFLSLCDNQLKFKSNKYYLCLLTQTHSRTHRWRSLSQRFQELIIPDIPMRKCVLGAQPWLPMVPAALIKSPRIHYLVTPKHCKRLHVGYTEAEGGGKTWAWETKTERQRNRQKLHPVLFKGCLNSAADLLSWHIFALLHPPWSLLVSYLLRLLKQGEFTFISKSFTVRRQLTRSPTQESWLLVGALNTKVLPLDPGIQRK